MHDMFPRQDHFLPGARRPKYRQPRASWIGPTASSKPVKANMNKYIRIIEQEIETVQGWIDHAKGVGCYHSNCETWATYVRAYERILELIKSETSRANRKPEVSPLLV